MHPPPHFFESMFSIYVDSEKTADFGNNIFVFATIILNNDVFIHALVEA